MNNKFTEIVFILDRSGSMWGLEDDTIGGFNSMMEKQKKQKGQALVTTVLFDDCYEILHDRQPLETLMPINAEQYYVRGCTALLDAIGRSISRIQNLHRHGDTAENVIFIIITDGMENASSEYTCHQIQDMIRKQKEAGWEFVFLGANMDAVKEASKMGIGEERSVTYENDGPGIALNYEVISETVSTVRACRPVASDWKKKIEEDHESRRG